MAIAGGTREVCAPKAFVLSQSWKIEKKKRGHLYPKGNYEEKIIRQRTHSKGSVTAWKILNSNHKGLEGFFVNDDPQQEY